MWKRNVQAFFPASCLFLFCLLFVYELFFYCIVIFMHFHFSLLSMFHLFFFSWYPASKLVCFSFSSHQPLKYVFLQPLLFVSCFSSFSLVLSSCFSSLFPPPVLKSSQLNQACLIIGQRTLSTPPQIYAYLCFISISDTVNSFITGMLEISFRYHWAIDFKCLNLSDNCSIIISA